MNDNFDRYIRSTEVKLGLRGADGTIKPWFDHTLVVFAIACIVTGIAVAVGLMLATDSASPEHEPVKPTPSSSFLEPYGGCDEAYLYPKSKGYADCKEHGRLP